MIIKIVLLPLSILLIAPEKKVIDDATALGKKLSKVEMKIALKISKINLIKKFDGGKTMDSLLGERNPVLQKIKIKDRNTSNNNILIAIHSFSDAPHVFGNSVFEDHYEWLRFLGNETKKNTKFNWLLKVHPIFLFT